MDQIQMREIVIGAVGERVLLHHPFYRRWEAGALSPGELSGYAEQYRHIEAALPQVLDAILEGLPDGHPRSLVERNLAEERGVPAAHLTMFEEFAGRVGARPAASPDESTARLVRLQHDSASRSAVAGIAALAAYECQAGDIARSKADGLRRHYGIDDARNLVLGRARSPRGTARRLVVRGARRARRTRGPSRRSRLVGGAGMVGVPRPARVGRRRRVIGASPARRDRQGPNRSVVPVRQLPD